MNSGKYEFLRVRRRFRQPLVTAHGVVEFVDRILLRTEIHDEIGYGEISPWPSFPTETVDEAREVLRSAQGSLSHLMATVAANKNAYPCLRSALSSCAAWNQIKSFSGKLKCAGLLTAPSPSLAQAKWGEDFKTIKLKINTQISIADIKSILLVAPSDGSLRLDANGSLDLAAARSWTEFVRGEKQIEFLEQPLPVGHAGYASLGPDKIALDESFLAPGGANWAGPVVVKPALVGDWQEFHQWRTSHTGPVIYSSAFETAIGRQAALWLAAQESSTLAHGFDTLGRFENDARDYHSAGPTVAGRSDLDWAKIWKELS